MLSSVVDTTKIEDEFIKIKYNLKKKLDEIETLLTEKESIKGVDNKEIFRQNQLQNKIDPLIREAEEDLHNLNTAYRSQERKKKYTDIECKKEMKEALENKFSYLKRRFEGTEGNEQEFEQKKVDMRLQIERLDQQLEERAKAQNKGANNEPNEYEDQFMKEMDEELKNQDLGLQKIQEDVGQIKAKAKNIGKLQDEVAKQTKKTTKLAQKTEAKLTTTNAKLKELLEKVRSGDKICIDIILVLICLGLIAVLYNIIKGKIDSPSTSSTNTNNTNTNSASRNFLYIL